MIIAFEGMKMEQKISDFSFEIAGGRVFGETPIDTCWAEPVEAATRETDGSIPLHRRAPDAREPAGKLHLGAGLELNGSMNIEQGAPAGGENDRVMNVVRPPV